MFQFKAKTSNGEVNPTNVNPNTALPNSYGKIRTLKDDFDFFKADNLKKGTEAAATQNAVVPEVEAFHATSPLVQQSGTDTKLATSQNLPEKQPGDISKGAEKKPAPAALETKKEFKGETLNPFGSQTFFQDKSPFEEAPAEIPTEKSEAAAKPKSRSNKTLVIVFSSLLILTIIGGGFYYYWFFIKKVPENIEAPAPIEKQTPVSQPDTQKESNSLRQLNIDTGLGKEDNQKKLRSFADGLLASASENDVVEIKVLNAKNEVVKPQDLETSLGITFPAGLAEKLNDDYSFFMKNENSEIRMGAAFKLSATEGLLENLKSQESTLPLNFTPFYLDMTLVKDVISFNSNRYKNADIRYFNFSSPPNTSFDYSIITDKQNSYFIFATSKYSIRSVLDYMSEK